MKTESSLLFGEHPIVVSRDLVKAVSKIQCGFTAKGKEKFLGLNEAIVLQQLNYWLQLNKRTDKNYRDGRYWTYNSIREWQETDFDFWSFDTVKRVFENLEKSGLLISCVYNKQNYDRTKWYSIDYDKLEESTSNQSVSRLVQNAPIEKSTLPQPIPEITTETNTENNISTKVHKDVFEENAQTISEPLVFEKFQKNESIFATTTKEHTKEWTTWGLNLVNWYIDVAYLKRTGKKHTPITKPARMTFARKILDFMDTVTFFDEDGDEVNPSGTTIKNMLIDFLNNSNADPQIMLATNKPNLGNWILKQPNMVWQSVEGTEYEPVGEWYE